MNLQALVVRGLSCPMVASGKDGRKPPRPSEVRVVDPLGGCGLDLLLLRSEQILAPRPKDEVKSEGEFWLSARGRKLDDATAASAVGNVRKS